MSFSTVPENTRIVFTNEEVTGPAAREMVRLSGIDDSSIVLDNATGGGVAALAAKAKIAADIDDSMLELAKSRGLETLKADQSNVPLDSASFTHVTNAFGVFFSPKDEDVLKETLRLLRPKGTAGFTSWKKISWWPEIESEMPLPVPSHAQLFSAKWDDPESIHTKMTKAGFIDVKITEFSFQPHVNIEKFVEAITVLIKVIAKRTWSSEDFARHSPDIEGRILKKLRQDHGETWNGSMTALITIGRKPERRFRAR